jgi:hypothetical protein
MNRVGAPQANAEAPITQMQDEKVFDPLSFVAPTEFVELPSKGICYPETHPLHNEETIEIKFMTAKEEDILSSRALLKKGIAIERFIQSVIVNPQIKAKDLLVGDRNAILIAARTSGYGNLYETQVGCPACGEKSSFTFDLNNKTVNESQCTDDVQNTGEGTFKIKMPYSKFNIVFRLLNGNDEAHLTAASATKKKTYKIDSVLSEQYSRMIVSIEGHSDRSIIKKYADNMPTQDSRHLRKCYKQVTPDVNIIEKFECHSCGHEQEMEVPFGADFFWPDR